MATDGWITKLNHDLVKRVLWPARDVRDGNRTLRPGELVVELRDEEGAEIDAAALWLRLRADAPAGAGAAALDAFGKALDAAVDAARRGDADGVLALESAFDDLARIVERS